MTVGEDGQASGTVIDGMLYLQTTKGAPKGRVVAVPAATPDQAHWRDIVPERDDAVIEGVTFGKGVIAVTYLKNASNVVEVFDPDRASRSVPCSSRALARSGDRGGAGSHRGVSDVHELQLPDVHLPRSI